VQAVLSLPAHPRSAREARAFVRETLHRWRLDAISDEAELLASELVTNVVLHVGTPLRVTLLRAGGRRRYLRVEVQDGSRRGPRRRNYSDEAQTGRGLMLVAQVASRHGVEVEPDGKRVWFELLTDDVEEAG
jgi:anti-sigma regulatory factor (Ser/Thr protein kinase)